MFTLHIQSVKVHTRQNLVIFITLSLPICGDIFILKHNLIAIHCIR